MAYIVMAYIVMAYIVMAHIVMAHIVMARSAELVQLLPIYIHGLNSYGLYNCYSYGPYS